MSDLRTLAAVLAGEHDPEVTELPDEPPGPVCIACKGYGWRTDPTSPVTNRVSVPCTVCNIVEITRRQRRMREAGIPAKFGDFSFETFPVTPKTQGALETCRAWAIGDEPPNGLFLWGPVGTGKTGLAVSILRALTDSYGVFLRVPDLLDAIRASYNRDSAATETQVLDLVRGENLVVLDDLGSERATDWVKERLFSIIGYRHDELLNTVFTSNLDLGKLGAQIGERTTHRIGEMCRVVHLDGPNLRATLTGM